MVFVTGGTGLIGAHLLYELTSSGKKVSALRRETSNIQKVKKIFSYYSENHHELFRQIEWVEGDVLDYEGLEELLKGVKEVYHCAAIVSFDPKDIRNMMRNNIKGTANMINASLENNVKKFCHISSVSALGNATDNYMADEETKWTSSKKVTYYSKSKFFSETEVWRGIEEGLNAVIVNPSIVLGPGNWNTGSSKLFKTIRDGMKFYTSGVTGFVDVRDVVHAMILLMDDKNFYKCRNQKFLLNSENISYKDIFSQIAVNLGKQKPAIRVSRFLLGIAWRFAAFHGWITGNSPGITRETAAASNIVKKFDGSKIKRYLDFQYTPVHESINHTTSILKQEMDHS
jgi:dihydroflavonol-4-reductase